MSDNRKLNRVLANARKLVADIESLLPTRICKMEGCPIEFPSFGKRAFCCKTHSDTHRKRRERSRKRARIESVDHSGSGGRILMSPDDREQSTTTAAGEPVYIRANPPPLCPKCGEPYFSHPRLGIAHRCAENSADAALGGK